MTKMLLGTLTLIASINTYADGKSICGNNDDRILSFEPRVGRLSTLEDNKGCTATMISDSCAITAGHCKPVLIKAEFNTPISQNGQPQPSADEDVYLIDQDTIQLQDAGPGKDWAVFKFKPNHLTGKLPGQVQGYYDVSFKKVRKGQQMRITGYGVERGDLTGNFAQQTHTGKIVKAGGILFGKTLLKHTADTTGGNSGSSIILEATQEIIGIHSHAGCTSSGGANQGTLLHKHKELIKAIKACLRSER
jgi:V8-like Glu-specific endopeptidase